MAAPLQHVNDVYDFQAHIGKAKIKSKLIVILIREEWELPPTEMDEVAHI